MSAEDIGGVWRQTAWNPTANALTPASLTRSAADARWRCRFLVADDRGSALGVLPLFRAKGARFTASHADPAAVAPAVFGTDAIAADRYLLLGGHTELVSGCVLAAGLAPDGHEEVTSALVDVGFATAADEDLIPAALYVRERQLAAFAGAGRTSVAVGEEYTLDVPDGEQAYLAALSHGRRSVVRRDWRLLDDRSLRATRGTVAEILDEALPLILAVKERHGHTDHVALIGMRMRSWAESSPQTAAFWVRDPDGRLLAVSFGCRYADTLEMHEIGLADHPGRQAAYAEVLVYAPLRYAMRRGLARIRLGLGAGHPKSLRGATAEAVWAIGTQRP